MYKKLSGILLVFSFPFSVIAIQSQQVDSSSLDNSQKIEGLTNGLGLNQEQKAKVKSIFNEQKAKLQAMPEEKRTHLQSLLTQQLDKIHQHKQSMSGK